jgi:PAS domain S-box-containing protein
MVGSKGSLGLILDKYFLALASANTDFIGIVDPIEFKLQFINHIPPYISASEMIGMEVFPFVAPGKADIFRSFLVSLANDELPAPIELESSSSVNGIPKSKAWYICNGVALKNDEGRVESILVVAKNITASKLQDIEIRNKEEKIYAILNNTNDVIMSIDRDYRITECNAAFSAMVKYRYNVQNPCSTSVLDYTDQKKHEHLKALYQKVLAGEVTTDIQRFETLTDQVVYYETNYHPIRNFNREITGISLFGKDITKRVLNEQKLISTLKEREVLLAEIHHRIKNNLALVSSMLQLKEINIDNPQAKEALSDSRKRIKSTALVHEMLYRNESFDRVVMQEYLTELFNNLNPNPKITLMLNGDNPVFDLRMALPFGLMMHELMMNSFKHSFKGKVQARLELSARLENGRLDLEYCDCDGAFPESLDFQDTSSTGLMLIHTFAEQLNATIQLTSRIPTRYLIQIPMA